MIVLERIKKVASGVNREPLTFKEAAWGSKGARIGARSHPAKGEENVRGQMSKKHSMSENIETALWKGQRNISIEGGPWGRDGQILPEISVHFKDRALAQEKNETTRTRGENGLTILDVKTTTEYYEKR